MLFYFCQRLLAHQGLVFLNPLPSYLVMGMFVQLLDIPKT